MPDLTDDAIMKLAKRHTYLNGSHEFCDYVKFARAVLAAAGTKSDTRLRDCIEVCARIEYHDETRRCTEALRSLMSVQEVADGWCPRLSEQRQAANQRLREFIDAMPSLAENEAAQKMLRSESPWDASGVPPSAEAQRREVYLRACGKFCAPDGTCSCAKFGDDPTECERRKEMERTLGVQEVPQDQQWKCGNEFLPFHPDASHVNPDYRDGWNRCYYAAMNLNALGMQEEPMKMYLCEFGKLVPWPNRTYVAVAHDDDCEECQSMAEDQREAYGESSAVSPGVQEVPQ